MPFEELAGVELLDAGLPAAVPPAVEPADAVDLPVADDPPVALAVAALPPELLPLELLLLGADALLPEPFESFAALAELLFEFVWLEPWAEDPEFLLAAEALPPAELLPVPERLELLAEPNGLAALAAASSEKIAPLPEELLRVLLPEDPDDAEFDGGGMLNATRCHSVSPGALRALVGFVLFAALLFAVLFSLEALDHLTHGFRALRCALPDLHFTVARRAGTGHDERLLAQRLFEPCQEGLVIPQSG